MALKDQTKELFATELELMVGEMPLSKVRVVELCHRCGTIPQTFYYHFHDKYELVAWMFQRDYAGTAIPSQGYSPHELERRTRGFEPRRLFYRKCFDERAQNSIAEYMAEFSMETAEQALQDAGLPPMAHEQALATRYHTYGIVGMMGEWFGENPDFSTAELTELLYDRTPDFLKEAFSRAGAPCA